MRTLTAHTDGPGASQHSSPSFVFSHGGTTRSSITVCEFGTGPEAVRVRIASGFTKRNTHIWHASRQRHDLDKFHVGL